MSSKPRNGAGPLVSVLTPCFNERAEILQQSLESLRAQTYVNFECLVVDDSTDPVLAAAAKAACDLDERFTYIHPPQRLGLAAGLNLALAQARGQLIARFDSDDLCDPVRLAAQVAFLADHPDVDVVGSSLRIIDDDGRPTALRRYPADHDSIAAKMQFSNAMAHPTVMIRRRVLDRLGAYDPSFRFAEDLELWLRLINGGARFANLDQPLVQYRQASTGRAPGNWSFNLKARTKNFSAALWPQRLLGMATIAAWACLPQGLRALIYRRAMLRELAAATNR